jgi:type II secretion system protein G
VKQMKKAFTLIELLIVVAIIAILAAIAVPNFLEAQTRAKASRSKADIRSLATGIEAYRIDNNSYPSGNPNNVSRRLTTDPQTKQYEVLERLSTPVAYMTSGLLPDPFRARTRSGTIDPSTGNSTPVNFNSVELQQEGDYKYAAIAQQPAAGVLALTVNTDPCKSFWTLWSVGPTGVKPQVAGTGLLSSSATPPAVSAWIYDPTNGTVSRGGIFRLGGGGVSSPAPGAVFYQEVSKVSK